jgi:hypothetical protein
MKRSNSTFKENEMRPHACCLMLLIFFLANQTVGAQWIEAKSAHYSIF